MKHLLAAILAFLTLTFAAHAQTFPSDLGAPIIDDAEMLSPEAEARMTSGISSALSANGSDVRVVTLISQAPYAGGEDIETYAGLLADKLGMTAQPEGRWARVLVFRDDQELRIETGPAFATSINPANIIETMILPSFQAGQLEGGIEIGTAMILGGTREGGIGVADPAPAPATEEPAAVAEETGSDGPAQGGGSGLYWIIGLIAVPVLGIIAMVRRSAARLAATPCPACGKTGMRQERVTLAEATEKAEGRGEVRTICPDCNHATVVPFTMPRTARTAGGKSAASTKATEKAGKDLGGGASGRW
jgi:uncharacterized protein